MPHIYILKAAKVGIETAIANLQLLLALNVFACLHIFVQSHFQKSVFMKLTTFLISRSTSRIFPKLLVVSERSIKVT